MKRCFLIIFLVWKGPPNSWFFSAPQINMAVIHCPCYWCLFIVLIIIPARDSKNRLHKGIHASLKWVKTSSFSYGSLTLVLFLLWLYRRWRQLWWTRAKKLKIFSSSPLIVDFHPALFLSIFFFWNSSLTATIFRWPHHCMNGFSAVPITFNRYYGALFLLGFIVY